MKTIPLPPLCLTLTPPWPQAIAYAEKRLENRHSSVVRRIGAYRGMIGLSQSKNWDANEAIDACNGILGDRRLSFETRKAFARELDVCATGPEDLSRVKPMAGKLWLVADLVEILSSDKCEGADWHIPGQWGLILGQVYKVEPVACMGGQGAWRPQWCPKCKKVVADSHGSACKPCKTRLAPATEAPVLRVVREL